MPFPTYDPSKECNAYNCDNASEFVVIPTTIMKKMCKPEFLCKECKDRQVNNGVTKTVYSVAEWQERHA